MFSAILATTPNIISFLSRCFEGIFIYYYFALFCMNYAKNGPMDEQPAELQPISRALSAWFTKTISEGKFPLLIRETIQFYLRHVAVFKARVLDNNRITIPKEEVDILGIRPGDYVAVILTKVER